MATRDGLHQAGGAALSSLLADGGGHLKQVASPPVRKPAAAGAADLIAKKLDRTAVNPIIVRLDDSRFLLISRNIR